MLGELDRKSSTTIFPFVVDLLSKNKRKGNGICVNHLLSVSVKRKTAPKLHKSGAIFGEHMLDCIHHKLIYLGFNESINLRETEFQIVGNTN